MSPGPAHPVVVGDSHGPMPHPNPLIPPITAVYIPPGPQQKVTVGGMPVVTWPPTTVAPGGSVTLPESLTEKVTVGGLPVILRNGEITVATGHYDSVNIPSIFTTVLMS